MSIYFYDLVPVFRRVVLLSALLYAGYQDYKTREIDDKTWVYPSILLAPLTFFEVYNRSPTYLQIYLVSLFLGLIIAVLTLKLKLTGEADAIAFVFISFFEPPGYHIITLFPLGSVIILSLVPTLLYTCYNLYWNLKHGSFAGYEAGSLVKALAMLTMRYISRKEYEEKSYMYIPSTQKQGDKLTIELSPMIPEKVEKPGLDEFWAVTLAPYVFFLSIGYLLYTILLLAF